MFTEIVAIVANSENEQNIVRNVYINYDNKWMLLP